MTLKNTQELEATRLKLTLLEERITAINSAAKPHDHATELTIRSLMRLAKQLKEEIARFEAGVLA